MSPPWTWNAFWFMFVPISVLVHAAQLPPGVLRRLGVVLLLIGIAGGLLAIAQVLGNPRGVLYPYRVSHFGVAVGLFANRNHNAVFLATLIPIAMVWLRRQPVRIRLDTRSDSVLDITNALAIVLIVAVFPLVLASGSRTGLAVLIVSVLVSLVFLSPFFRKTSANGRKARNRGLFLTMLVVLCGLAVTGLAFRNDRALSIDRLFQADPLADMRTKILPTTFAMIRLYAPLGSGVGTFEPVYQIHEPDELLFPTYVNHVHNDWLEVVLTAGFPGAILLGLMVLAWIAGGWLCFSRTTRRNRPDHDLAIAGLIVIFLTGIASASDYPLRTPSFSALFTIVILWVEIGLSRNVSNRTSQQVVQTAGASAKIVC